MSVQPIIGFCGVSSMAVEGFRIVKSEQGIHELQGVLDIHHVDKLMEFLEEASKGAQDIRISLSHLTYIDISALQALISFKNSPSVSISLRISSLSPEVEEILSISGLRTALLA